MSNFTKLEIGDWVVVREDYRTAAHHNYVGKVISIADEWDDVTVEITYKSHGIHETEVWFPYQLQYCASEVFKKRRCTCGSEYTSFPKFHYEWCDLV